MDEKGVVFCIDCKHRVVSYWILQGSRPLVKCKLDKQLHVPADTCPKAEKR